MASSGKGSAKAQNPLKQTPPLFNNSMLIVTLQRDTECHSQGIAVLQRLDQAQNRQSQTAGLISPDTEARTIP
jgi:hypothetical protein